MKFGEIASDIASKLSFWGSITLGTFVVGTALLVNTFSTEAPSKKLIIPPISSEKICDKTELVSMPMGGTTGSKFAPENKNPRKEKVRIRSFVDKESNEIFLEYLPEGFDKERTSSRTPLESDYAVINSSWTGAAINMPSCAKIESQDQQSFRIEKGWDTNMKSLEDHPEAKFVMVGGDIVMEALTSRIPYSEKLFQKMMDYSEKNNLLNIKAIPNLLPEKLNGSEVARKTRIKLNLEDCVGEVKFLLAPVVYIGREFDANRQGNFGSGRLEGMITFAMQGGMTEEEKVGIEKYFLQGKELQYATLARHNALFGKNVKKNPYIIGQEKNKAEMSEDLKEVGGVSYRFGEERMLENTNITINVVQVKKDLKKIISRLSETGFETKPLFEHTFLIEGDVISNFMLNGIDTGQILTYIKILLEYQKRTKGKLILKTSNFEDKEYFKLLETIKKNYSGFSSKELTYEYIIAPHSIELLKASVNPIRGR